MNIVNAFGYHVSLDLVYCIGPLEHDDTAFWIGFTICFLEGRELKIRKWLAADNHKHLHSAHAVVTPTHLNQLCPPPNWEGAEHILADQWKRYKTLFAGQYAALLEQWNYRELTIVKFDV